MLGNITNQVVVLSWLISKQIDAASGEWLRSNDGLSSIDLPEPLAPISAMNSPLSTLSDSSDQSVRSPKASEAFWICSSDTNKQLLESGPVCLPSSPGNPGLAG